jgi:type IV pilus assembly protein PilC
MEFRCRLGTPAGEIVEGLYVADSEAHLRRDLEEKGLYVLSLRRQGLSLSFGGVRQRIKGHEFLVFNQELATLLKAGMPLVQSLDILRQRIPNRTFKTVLDSVHDKVKGGVALSDAFAEHQSLFPAVYSASLLAGERSGNLDTVIRRYVSYEKIVSAVRRRTISALIYPAILITMMIVLVSIIVLRVVPAFSEFYDSFQGTLPLSTRIIVAISDTISSNIILIIGGAVALVVLSMTWLRLPAQRQLLHRWLLDVPWVGATALKFYMSQLGRTLSTLLGGGIPLVNALEISVRAISNRHLAGELDTVRLRVQEGQGFAAALRERGVFPDVAVKMVEVGESTGALQEMLNSLADFYDEEVDTEVGRFITMIEPILLIGMGIIIAVVVLSLYMPLFELTSLVGT